MGYEKTTDQLMKRIWAVYISVHYNVFKKGNFFQDLIVFVFSKVRPHICLLRCYGVALLRAKYSLGTAAQNFIPLKH